MNFAIETIGVPRLEARASTQDGRGNGALQRKDQALWGVTADEWRFRRLPVRTTIHQAGNYEPSLFTTA